VIQTLPTAARVAPHRGPFGERRFKYLLTAPSILVLLLIGSAYATQRAVEGKNALRWIALGRNNLILLSGERHRAMRKLQNPQFHGERLSAYGEVITSIADEHIGRWPREQPFPIQETMQAISLDVILQAVLGLSDPTRRAAFKEAVLSLVASLKPSFMFMRALRRPMLGLSAWARFQRRRAAAAALFTQELAVRLQQPCGGVFEIYVRRVIASLPAI
jgi:cytochrome P450